MRKSNEQPISKIIEEMIKENNLSDGITQAKINSIWVELMTPPILSRTNKLRFKEGVLRIHLTSSVIRNELDYQKEDLKKAFNEKLGGELISKIELFY